jgi:hypothetical protein
MNMAKHSTITKNAHNSKLFYNSKTKDKTKELISKFLSVGGPTETAVKGLH